MSMDAARWSRRGALAGGAALAVGGLVGCVGGRSGRTTASVDPRALPLGSVRVRLPPHQGTAPLEVVVDGELRRLSRGPSGVVLDGRVAPRQRLEPMRELRLRGELHRGTLEVVPTAGGLGTYLELDLETYVAGVVAAELSLWSARPAELEAQAIAARSYATATLAQRRALGSRAALESGTQDQAYRGTYEPADSAGARAAGARLHAAVAATRGMVLELGGSPLAARYSAACGGRTSDLAAVFPAASDRRAGLRGAVCPACTERARAEAAAGQPAATRPLGWEVTFSPSELRSAGLSLGLQGAPRSLEPEVDAGGRWITVRLEGPDGAGRTVPADALRAALGRGRMKSTLVTHAWPRVGQPITGGLLVRGLGRGHGVGLCQEGARDLAGWGWSSERILGTYYPGAALRHARA